MGMCLRGKMADAGMLTRPATAVIEPAAVATAETATPEPQLDVTPPQDIPAKPDEDMIAATFGLLRAEPDGSVVIAGSGAPGSEVEVYSNGDLLGKAKVETSGDWVLVPDAPIPSGGTELTLAEAGKPGRAAESFVVVVNDDKTSEPLVVASTPGTASEVLQGLTRPPVEASTEIAAADPLPTPKPTTLAAKPVATPSPVETIAAPSAVAPPAKPDVAVPAVTEPVLSTAETPPPEPAVPDVAVTDTPPVDRPVEPATADVPATKPAPEVMVAEPAPKMALAEAKPPTTTPALAGPAVVSDAAPPTIDAIEIEGERSFFAGSGPEGAVIRLYIDGSRIADATVADGRWLVEAGNVLTKPSQRVRVDLLKAGTADVAARAEVDFKIDLPAQKPIAVATAEPESSVEAPTPASEPNPAPAVETKSNTPNIVAAPDEKSAGAANIDDTPQVVLADKSTAMENRPGMAVTSSPAETTPSTSEPAPAASEIAQPAVTATAQPEAGVAGEAPLPETQIAEPTPALAEGGVPTMTAVAVGDPDMARFAAGKAIIRHGDNLWTIARRVYGAGIKYTTIYKANNEQIRNPDRIYPGQVFDLPESAE